MTSQYEPHEEMNLDSILDIIHGLNKLKDVDMILDRTLLEARALAKADAGSIFLLKKNKLSFSHVQNDTLYGERGAGAAQYSNLTLPISSDTIVGHSALTREVVVIDDAYNLGSDVPFKFDSSFDEEHNYRSISIITIPLLTSSDTLVGVVQLINAKDDNGETTVFSEQSKKFVPLFANNAAEVIERSMLNRKIILRMVKMAELHDPKETGAHVMRVSTFSAEIYQRWAENRNLPPNEIKHFRDLLSLAAMTHDSGKVGISDNILKKPARLTPDEFDVMKQHSRFGAQLFSNSSNEMDQMSYEVTLHHHQKWNGTGYPSRAEDGETLAGEDIPLAARVVALADVFDALSSRRCYKEPWEEEKVFELIRRESGEHFDPELVQAFFEITDIIRAIQQKYKS